MTSSARDARNSSATNTGNVRRKTKTLYLLSHYQLYRLMVHQFNNIPEDDGQIKDYNVIEIKIVMEKNKLSLRQLNVQLFKNYLEKWKYKKEAKSDDNFDARQNTPLCWTCAQFIYRQMLLKYVQEKNGINIGRKENEKNIADEEEKKNENEDVGKGEGKAVSRLYNKVKNLKFI